MRFDPHRQEYVSQNPAIDRTTANIVGTQNPVANPQELELGAEIASGGRSLSALSYTELMSLDDLDLGHQTNKLVISEMLSRNEDPVSPASERPISPEVDQSLAESDITAEEAFKSDHRDEYKDDRLDERNDDSQNDRRSR